MLEKSPALHCKYCGKSFFSKSHLNVHLRSHTREKGFLAMDTFERPLSIVASENNKVTLRKERFTTILAMKSR